MGDGMFEAGHPSGTARSTSADPFGKILTDRQLSLVKSRLIANLGGSVASWFRIAPSDQTASGDLRLAALLLERHLPILVPVADYEAGGTFYIARYDIYGRRAELSQGGEMSRFSSLAEALLAADVAFRDLKYHSDAYHAERGEARNTGELPEEQWLHGQLRHVVTNA